MLVTNPIENTNLQETVTVNEIYFQVKQDAENPKMSNRASFFYPSGTDWSVSLHWIVEETPSVPSG